MKESRNTIQRQLVLEAVKRLKSHPTADEVYREVLKTAPNISRSTVYRNLNTLSETGEILHILLPDSADCYDHRTDTHYHAHCRLCGKVTDVELPEINTLLNNLPSDSGFTYEQHSLVFIGLCQSCSHGHNS
ncbi:MAG: transcriptional repressor [Clostridiales bacterium]|nr:transcriptional repressor [Clostridiales bacterium]MCD8214868.1 transcriptional repressor [Clostridiales bacterium]